MTGVVPMAPDEAEGVLIRVALGEDVGTGDWTTAWTVPKGAVGEAEVVAKGDVVVAGSAVATRVFRTVDPRLEVDIVAADGTPVAPGGVVLRIQGPLSSILTAERTALNLLQRLSGVATLTRRFVDAVAGTGCTIVDTRKTTPGWRHLEKAAVRAGGGSNHRMGLWDMVMIKENHVAAAGGIGAAVAAVRRYNTEELAIEVEVRDLEELETALALEVDRILLDNMSLEDMRTAVSRVRMWSGSVPELEASGNVTLERVGAIADAGVDLVSVGALTHSAPAADLSLLVRQEGGA